MRVVLAISGASGASLGLKTLRALPEGFEKHVVISEHALAVLEREEALKAADFENAAPNVQLHPNEAIWAPIASGSFRCDAMLVIPCSMNTLSKIAVGIADNLITRAAAVMIKERRRLLLAPREMPFSAIALEQMHKLSLLGVDIAPPVLGYYSSQTSLAEMEDFMIGKWFDVLGIPNDRYRRWK